MVVPLVTADLQGDVPRRDAFKDDRALLVEVVVLVIWRRRSRTTTPAEVGLERR